jgi:Calcineurin-like phosphoesterase
MPSLMGLDNVASFDQWLGQLPHLYKVFVPGNHDAAFAKARLSNATVLINDGVEIAGLKSWGTPINAVGPAFQLSSAAERRRIFAEMPDDTDVLVTHASPYVVLDQHGGDQELRAAVDRVRPIIHSFGHIHSGPATATIGNTLFINAALLGPDGALRGQPVVVKLPRVCGLGMTTGDHPDCPIALLPCPKHLATSLVGGSKRDTLPIPSAAPNGTAWEPS